jgi:deoxyribodipyrimidine photo-lyase
MTDTAPIILVFRRDLRVNDNPALARVAASGRPVIPVYIRDETLEGRPIGAAAKWWLDKSLASLGAKLDGLGSRLVLRSGDSRDALLRLIEETGATAVAWNRLHEPLAAARDRDLAEALKAAGAPVGQFDAQGLARPGEVLTGSGGAYRVFGAFQRAMRPRLETPALEPASVALAAPEIWPESEALMPFEPDWSKGFEVWTPGEDAALERLEDFIAQGLDRYPEGRDLPGVDGSTRLSPHLHFGEISPWRVVSDALHAARTEEVSDAAAEKLVGEVLWREFNLHLLADRPDLGRANLRAEFDNFPWRTSNKDFQAWTRGQTGYPIVDAGMRQLWATGWMHNRVRMVVASFLVKHLLIDWRAGEAWFWDTLVDADEANNAANWQWVAGSGADASPYFRIFNPILQGQRFDPQGAYVRQWVPEIAALPDKVLHAPFAAPDAVLAKAGVVLGRTYPKPIVDHGFARNRALEAYGAMRATQKLDEDALS